MWLKWLYDIKEAAAALTTPRQIAIDSNQRGRTKRGNSFMTFDARLVDHRSKTWIRRSLNPHTPIFSNSKKTQRFWRKSHRKMRVGKSKYSNSSFFAIDIAASISPLYDWRVYTVPPMQQPTRCCIHFLPFLTQNSVHYVMAQFLNDDLSFMLSIESTIKQHE